MDSLNDILSRKDFEEPPEITEIKRYIAEHFHAEVSVAVNQKNIVITAPNAALAGSLRLESPRLQSIIGSDKRLVLRIGR